MPARPTPLSAKIALWIIGIVGLSFFLTFNDAINIAPYNARVASCRANLNQIRISVESYQSGHAGKMPPTLKVLMPFIGSQTAVECPESGYVDTPGSGFGYANVSYDYRFLANPKGMDVICWDSRPHQPRHAVFTFLNHPNRNVLLADGQVKNMREDEFQKLHLSGQSWTLP